MRRSSNRAKLEPGSCPTSWVIMACRPDLCVKIRGKVESMLIPGGGMAPVRTVDFRLSGERDVGAAKAFFRAGHQRDRDRPHEPSHWTDTRRRIAPCVRDEDRRSAANGHKDLVVEDI